MTNDGPNAAMPAGCRQPFGEKAVPAEMADPIATGPGRGRLPSWMRRALPEVGQSRRVRGLLKGLHLDTVCVSAHCPNQAECFCRGTATFMILGRQCTRTCRFCAVAHDSNPPAVRADDPAAVAEAADKLGLRHVVVTSVTRDDLPDGGAGHFAATIEAVRRRLPAATVEVLTPDFGGDLAAVDTVLAAGPDVFNHNIETTARLYRAVRPQADYSRSLAVLARASRPTGPDRPGRAPVTKSGLMVGLGESPDEVRQVLADLRSAGVNMLTVGQYLAPSPTHAAVERFVTPEQFDAIAADARQMGFAAVAAGPYVRSSYHAGDMLKQLCS